VRDASLLRDIPHEIREERIIPHVRRFLIYEPSTLCAVFQNLSISILPPSPFPPRWRFFSRMYAGAIAPAAIIAPMNLSLFLFLRSDRSIASFNGLCIRIQMASLSLSFASPPSVCSQSYFRMSRIQTSSSLSPFYNIVRYAPMLDVVMMMTMNNMRYNFYEFLFLCQMYKFKNR